MNSAIERLLALRVSDVMAREVVTVPQSESLQAVASRFTEREISGAPVIDDQGCCVGVISGFDFIRRSIVGENDEGLPGQRHVLVQDSPDEPLHLEEFNSEAVEAYMSRDVQSVKPQATMLDAARKMCAEHVHRLVVVDDSGAPVGLLSSLDVVAAMVASIEE